MSLSIVDVMSGELRRQVIHAELLPLKLYVRP